MGEAGDDLRAILGEYLGTHKQLEAITERLGALERGHAEDRKLLERIVADQAIETRAREAALEIARQTRAAEVERAEISAAWARKLIAGAITVGGVIGAGILALKGALDALRAP